MSGFANRLMQRHSGIGINIKPRQKSRFENSQPVNIPDEISEPNKSGPGQSPNAETSLPKSGLNTDSDNRINESKIEKENRPSQRDQLKEIKEKPSLKKQEESLVHPPTASLDIKLISEENSAIGENLESTAIKANQPDRIVPKSSKIPALLVNEPGINKLNEPHPFIDFNDSGDRKGNNTETKLPGVENDGSEESTNYRQNKIKPMTFENFGTLNPPVQIPTFPTNQSENISNSEKQARSGAKGDTTIKVSIGRIEIKASPQPTIEKAREKKLAPVMTLSEYLEKQNKYWK